MLNLSTRIGVTILMATHNVLFYSTEGNVGWTLFFRIFEIIIFCCVVAICDLVHDVETIFHLSYVLTASGNLF